MNSVPPWASSSAPGLRGCSPLDCFDPEQFDFHPLRRDGRGVDDDERSLGAARGDMQRARRQFLARAGRADDQDAAIGLGRPLDGLAQLVHAGGAASQRACSRRKLLQFLHLALEARGFQRPGRDQDQPVGLERLFDEVIGAALDRRDRGFDIAVAGDHHDRQVGIVLLDLLQQLQARRACCPAARYRGTPGAGGGWQSRQAPNRCRARSGCVKPSSSRMPATRSRISASSSTIRMSLCHRLHLSCQLPVAASVFVSLLVVAARSVVSESGGLFSSPCPFVR